MLHGSSYFCILDIPNAYLHINLDEESSKKVAIFTHRGTHLVNRSFFFLSGVGGKYHSTTAPIISNLAGCISYSEDILIFSKDETECEANLKRTLEKFEKFNLY